MFWKTIIANKQTRGCRHMVSEYAPTLTAAMGAGGGMIPMLTNLRIEHTGEPWFFKAMRRPHTSYISGLVIRRLTPRECFRLMDVPDRQIEKIQATGLSVSAQYRLAGNSICVCVLYHVFRKLFIDVVPELSSDMQLKLF